MKSLFIISLLPVLLSGLLYKPGPDPGDKIIEGLQQWHDNHPQEKIFLQSDRENYGAGETIWFKLWCAIDNKPGYLSKIVYTTLTDRSGKVVDKKMYSLDPMSASNGLFDLDKELKTGNYTLSAYTLWMLNYPQFISHKNIYVYGSDFKNKPAVNKPGKNLFNFFPEGGDLFEAVYGQVAFKATTNDGLPVGFKGTIYSSDNTKVIDIQSSHDGMGAIDLEPIAGKTYIAKITFDNGQTGEFKLPVAKKEGIALQVNNNSPSRIAVVLNRGNTNKEKYSKIFVVAQVNGIPVFKANFNIDEGEVGTSIPKKNLPPGIMQITAFDSIGNPLSERLVFIDNYNVITPALTIQSLNTNKRGHNVWQFKLDSLDATSISVLVMNADVDPLLNQKENITSSFFLSNDIKGYIHNPGYYFSDKTPTTLQNLDLLLMTQGWRRFTWKQIIGKEEIALKYPVETYMNIRGLVTKSGRKEPVKDGLVTLITKTEDSTTILTNAKLTDKGEFIVDSITFREKAKISYEGTDNNKAKLPVDVTLYPAHVDSLRQTSWIAEERTDNLLSQNDNTIVSKHVRALIEAQDSFNSKTLAGVTVTAKKMSRTDSLQKQYVSPIYEISDQSLIIDAKRNYLNIWQFLNESIPGFNVNPFQPGGVTYASFSRYDGLSLTDSEQGIKFLINEMPVSIDAIDALNPGDVALVKVYKGATGFPLGAESGAISVYTKKGVDIKRAAYEKTFTTADKIGFAFTREFYSPNYAAHPDLNKNKSDNRLTLYWNPSAKRTASGEYIVDFHNDDQAKEFKLVIQGWDKNGRMIYAERLIK